MTAPTFFVDRSLGRYAVPEALRASGLDVQIHDDLFEADAADPDWLPEVGRRGWFVITKDQRIRYRPMERKALLDANVGAFVVTAGNLGSADLAALIARHAETLLRVCAMTPRPFIAHVSREGLAVREPRERPHRR